MKSQLKQTQTKIVQFRYNKQLFDFLKKVKLNKQMQTLFCKLATIFISICIKKNWSNIVNTKL